MVLKNEEGLKVQNNKKKKGHLKTSQSSNILKVSLFKIIFNFQSQSVLKTKNLKVVKGSVSSDESDESDSDDNEEKEKSNDKSVTDIITKVKQLKQLNLHNKSLNFYSNSELASIFMIKRIQSLNRLIDLKIKILKVKLNFQFKSY